MTIFKAQLNIPRPLLLKDLGFDLENHSIASPAILAMKINKEEEKTDSNANKGKAEVKKKETKPKAEKKELPVDVSRILIRVGKIVSVQKHEAADTLYVEKVFFFLNHF